MSDFVLVPLFLTLNRFHTLFGVSTVDFEQVNAGWYCRNILLMESISCRITAMFESVIRIYLLSWKKYLKVEVLFLQMHQLCYSFIYTVMLELLQVFFTTAFIISWLW